MPLNLLFLCSKNRLRSPTAEQVFAHWPDVETASAGISNDADNPVSAELLAWADLIFVMERAHHRKLAAKFKSHLANKRIINLAIPDEHEFMNEALIALLKTRVPRHLPTR